MGKNFVKIGKAPRSKHRHAEETEEEEYEDEEEEEEQNEWAGIVEKNASCSKAGYQRATARKYVPIDVIKGFNFELPSSITIRDSTGREFETKLKNWKDGRIWLIGGWHSLCRWNLVEKDVKCICEFVKGKGNKVLYLQVQILHEGSVSNSNTKYKKLFTAT
uniref:B3 domain-containing protein n=1 Tax=Solanum tuberosum TaxID=4113 RepID=M1CFK5_SOLTU